MMSFAERLKLSEFESIHDSFLASRRQNSLNELKKEFENKNTLSEISSLWKESGLNENKVNIKDKLQLNFVQKSEKGVEIDKEEAVQVAKAVNQLIQVDQVDAKDVNWDHFMKNVQQIQGEMLKKEANLATKRIKK